MELFIFSQNCMCLFHHCLWNIRRWSAEPWLGNTALNCEVREKTNKMQQLDVYFQQFLNMFRASLCPSSGEQDMCVTARGVLRWFCWMWLVAVVGRCLVGCEHCEGYCSNSNLHSARTLQRSPPQPLPTTSSRTSAAHHMQ